MRGLHVFSGCVVGENSQNPSAKERGGGKPSMGERKKEQGRTGKEKDNFRCKKKRPNREKTKKGSNVAKKMAQKGKGKPTKKTKRKTPGKRGSEGKRRYGEKKAKDPQPTSKNEGGKENVTSHRTQEGGVGAVTMGGSQRYHKRGGLAK